MTASRQLLTVKPHCLRFHCKDTAVCLVSSSKNVGPSPARRMEHFNENRPHSHWSFYDVPHELKRQKSEYDSCSKDSFAETVELCGNFLNHKGHVYMFCSAVQFLPWVKAVSRWWKAVFLKTQNTNCRNEKELCSTKNSNALCTWETGRISIRTLVGSLLYVSMVERAVYFRQRGLDSSRMLLNVHYQIQKPHDHVFPSKTNRDGGSS